MIFGKVMWMARATTTVVGLAIMLALVLGVATAAFGANGDFFKLGNLKNSATALTRLTGNVDGAALQVVNPNTGANDTALSLSVQAGEAPMRVNSATKVANLNADQLDGQDSTAFLGANQKAADSELLDGKNASEFAADANQNGKADAAEQADNATNAGNADTVDGKHAADFAAATHNHDERYYTETESDGRYLFKGQKAADSEKLDGFEANQIVRATGATNSSGIDNFDKCDFSTVAVSKTVTAPTNGILLITGNVWAARDADSANVGQLFAILAVDGMVILPQMGETLGAGEGDEGSIALTTTRAVAAGTHTVDLRLAECGSGMARVKERSVTTLFVPFGNAGSVGSLD
jgi:hypothetical protein